MVKDWLAQHQASNSELQHPLPNSSEDKGSRQEFVAIWNPISLTGAPTETRIDYWIFGAEHSHDFVVRDDSQLLAVSVNGKPVSWEKAGSTIHLQLPILPHGLPAFLSFTIAQQSINEDDLPILPKHRDAPAILSTEERLGETMEALESAMEWIPDTIEEGSFAHRWLLDLIKVAMEPNVEVAKQSRSREDVQAVVTRLNELLELAEEKWPHLRWPAFEFLSAEPVPIESNAVDARETWNPISISYWLGSTLLIASVFIFGVLWRDHPEKLFGWLAGIAWVATGFWVLAGALLAACLVTMLDNLMIRRSSPLPRRALKSRITNL
jgi:hypothetical protein